MGFGLFAHAVADDDGYYQIGIIHHGTEADGGLSPDYCSYCYENGKFTADVTMDQMIDFCAKPMADATGMTADEAKEFGLVDAVFDKRPAATDDAAG